MRILLLAGCMKIILLAGCSSTFSSNPDVFVTNKVENSIRKGSVKPIQMQKYGNKELYKLVMLKQVIVKLTLEIVKRAKIH
jgi:hypothetical protein